MRVILRAGSLIACLFLFSAASRGQVFDNQCPVGQSSMVPLRTVNITTGHFNDTVCADIFGNLSFLALNASLSASDTFTRANGPLGPNWTVTSGNPTILSNAVNVTSLTFNMALWSNPAFTSTAQFAQVSMVGTPTAGASGPVVFGANSAYTANGGTGYVCTESSTLLAIQRLTISTTVTLTSSAITGVSGDTVRLEITSAGAMTCYLNGASILTTTDTNFKSGSPGIFLKNNAGISPINNWSGGNLPVSLGQSPAFTYLQCKNFEGIACVDGTAYAQNSTGINQAITDLLARSSNGGEIWLAPGTYSISNTVSVGRSNIKLLCKGGSISINSSVGSCLFNWTGSGGGTMVSFDPAVTQLGPIGGVALSGVTINGASSAGTCLKVYTVVNSNFDNLDIRGCTNFGWDMGVDTNVLSNPNNQKNTMTNNFIGPNGTNGVGIRETGGTVGGTFYDTTANTWIGLSVQGGTANGDALLLENVDNDRWYNIVASANGTGFGIHFTCRAAATDQRMCSFENIFNGAQTGLTGIKQDGNGAFYATANIIHGYELCNGSPIPSTTAITKGSFYIDTLDCTDTNFTSYVFGLVGGVSTLLDTFNFSTGRTITPTVTLSRTTTSSQNQLVSDSTSAGLNQYFQWNDFTAGKWLLGKTAANDWRIFDLIASKDRLLFAVPAAGNSATDLKATGTSSIVFNRDSGSGVLFFNGSNAQVAVVNSSGSFGGGVFCNQGLTGCITPPSSGTLTMPALTSTVPGGVFSSGGTAQTGTVHIVQDTATLAAGTVTVTFTGSAVFTNATSYTCVADDDTAIGATRVLQNSGSSVTITGTGTDVIRYICIGN